MKSLERVMGALTGQAIDRVPVGATLSLYGAKLIKCDLETYYNDPQKYYEGQKAILDTFDTDLIISPLCVTKEAEAFGASLKYYHNGPPNIKKRAYNHVEDFKKFELPSLDQKQFTYVLDSIQLLSNTYGGEIPIGGVWLDPFDMLANIAGPELFMELMLYNRSVFDDVIEQLRSFSIDYANQMLDHGANMIIVFASLCNTAMITKDMAQEIFYPVLESTFKKIKGGIVLHHGGYKIGPFIPIYRRLPNLIAFLLDKADDLQESYDACLEHQMIIGNISGATMDCLEPKQIKMLAQIALDKMKDRSRFMLFTSAADIPFATEVEQIKAWFQSVKKDKVIGLSCGIFENEIEILKREGKLPCDFIYLDSRLHMKPDELKKKLDSKIDDLLKSYEKILLVYGDCHPYMVDSYDPERVFRLEGINCCNIIMGSKKYRKLRKEGAFFVFYEWAHRWKEIFVEDIGLTDQLAPIFMNDMHSKIIYLDTGVGPVPIQILDNMSKYFNLPYEVMSTDLSTLEEAINNGYKEVTR